MVGYLLLFYATSKAVELGQPIAYMSYDEIVQGLHQLQQQYPQVITLYSAQEAFQLPHIGSCGEEPCKTWIVELVNRTGKTPQQVSISSKVEIVLLTIDDSWHNYRK